VLECLKGLGITLGVTGLVFAPLLVYFATHPAQFFSHTADVSIFVPHGDVPPDIGAALTSNAVRLLRMFFIEGDGGMIRNVPGRPVFDPFLALLFLAGVLVLLLALVSKRATVLDRRRAALLLIWAGGSLGLSLFSDDDPNFGRILPAMPAIVTLPAWGASELWDRLRPGSARRIGAFGLGLAIAASTWLAYRDYFIVLGNDPGLYYAFNADKEEVSAWLNRNATRAHIYVAPVWYQVSTISLLTRNSPLKSFESRDTIVLPVRSSGKDAVFVFPYEQERKAQTMQSRLGDLGRIEHITGTNGNPLFLSLRVPVENLPDSSDPLDALKRGGLFLQPKVKANVLWGDELQLLGFSIDPEGPGGRNLAVSLFLHSLKPIQMDYSFSVKARAENGRVWGQDDKWPGDNSYATTWWSPGDVVIERFYPGLNACAPAGNYHVTVEVYDPKTMRVLGLNEGGNVLDLGGARAEASAGNRLEDLEPDLLAEARIGAFLKLIGITRPQQVRTGQSFSFALFWSGVGDGTMENAVQIRLQDASKREFLLAEKQIRIPSEDRGLCTFLEVRAPDEVAPGTGAILVNGIQIATLDVVR
jgi:hypothetical protein